MSKFKIKVKPFDFDCNFYVIYYSFNRGFTYHRYERNYLTNVEYYCDDQQPILYNNFEYAVKIAKELTEEKIKQHNLDKKLEYYNHIQELQKNRKNRYKTYVK